MKKLVLPLLLVSIVLALGAVLLLNFSDTAIAVGIIGSADGPTSIVVR